MTAAAVGCHAAAFAAAVQQQQQQARADLLGNLMIFFAFCRLFKMRNAQEQCQLCCAAKSVNSTVWSALRLMYIVLIGNESVTREVSCQAGLAAQPAGVSRRLVVYVGRTDLSFMEEAACAATLAAWM
jgi:hypothetical protein